MKNNNFQQNQQRRANNNQQQWEHHRKERRKLTDLVPGKPITLPSTQLPIRSHQLPAIDDPLQQEQVMPAPNELPEGWFYVCDGCLFDKEDFYTTWRVKSSASFQCLNCNSINDLLSCPRCDGNTFRKTKKGKCRCVNCNKKVNWTDSSYY